MNQTLMDRFDKTKNECIIHIQRMEHAHTRVQRCLPLTVISLNQLTPDDISFMDQFIFRFAKLQDAMGDRLLPYSLKLLGEDIQGKPFIDMLNRLEKLSLIPSAQKWLEWRELRNDVSHEYPDSLDERVEALNLLPTAAAELKAVYLNITEYISSRIDD